MDVGPDCVWRFSDGTTFAERYGASSVVPFWYSALAAAAMFALVVLAAVKVKQPPSLGGRL
jgi:hypothetical protein